MESHSHQVKVFEARGLSKTYVMGEVKVHVLRDIDLDIYEHEFVVLLGLSGQVARGFIPGEGFSNLLRDPFGRRMCSHIDPDKLSPRRSDDDQNVEQAGQATLVAHQSAQLFGQSSA